MTRIYLSRILKIVFFVSTASFLFIQVQISRRSHPSGKNLSDPQSVFGPGALLPDAPGDALRQDDRNNNGSQGIASPPLATNSVHPVADPDKNLPSPYAIRQLIEDNNLHAEVLNEEKYGPANASSVVIVVQVHNRPKYLEKLIQSLSVARDISGSLLIFSHDFYSDELNKLVRQITFCRVIQIFYPYPIQIFPDRFPGQDPRDCATNVGRDEAKTSGCQNWAYPDKYGHYRSASITQIKHHWWWKTNFVFDGIQKLRNYSGYVLFLEEDHYVSPDFLHVLNLIIQNKESLCSECSVIALGFYLKTYGSYANSMSQLAVYPWFSSRHNMGMAINRETWNRIRECSKLFCEYDDYNWDWSLLHVNLRCLKPGPMTVIYAKSPRVLHIGDCGIHHQGKQCTADASASKVSEILNAAKAKLFPESLTVAERSRRTLKAPKENGGWGDIRDHYLCMNHTLWLVQQSTPAPMPIDIVDDDAKDGAPHLNVDVKVSLDPPTTVAVLAETALVVEATGLKKNSSAIKGDV